MINSILVVRRAAPLSRGARDERLGTADDVQRVWHGEPVTTRNAGCYRPTVCRVWSVPDEGGTGRSLWRKSSGLAQQSTHFVARPTPNTRHVRALLLACGSKRSVD